MRGKAQTLIQFNEINPIHHGHRNEGHIYLLRPFMFPPFRSNVRVS